MKRLLLALMLVLASASQVYAAAVTGTLTSGVANSAVTLAVEGRGSIGLQLKGSWTGTVAFQGTLDTESAVSAGTATWATFAICPVDGSAAVSSTTATGIWTVDVSGLTHIRAISTAGTTGDANVLILSASPTGRSACTAASSSVITNFLGVTALGQATAANSIPVVQASNAAFTINPTTSGGLTPFFLLASTDTATTGKVIKASAGQLYGVQAFSLDATPVYLKFYDKATGPTCASDTIVKQLTIPANATASLAAGFLYVNLNGVAFSAGISFCATTGIAANDTGALTASEVEVNADYK